MTASSSAWPGWPEAVTHLLLQTRDTTFDLPLFLTISVCAVLAVAVAVPRQILSILDGREDGGAGLPSRRLVMIGAGVQQSLIAVGLTAVGTALAPGTGLSAPWFHAVSRGRPGLGEAAAQIPAALLVGGLCTAVFLIVYYRGFRPRMSEAQVARTEALRTALGLPGRVLMGGVAEEVMFRWGVMSFFAWLTIPVAGLSQPSGMWIAITVSGILFGLGHLPGAVAVGVEVTRLVVAAAVVLNLIVAIGFGWLFWQYGLLAAVIAHALLHVVWHPLERRAARVLAPVPSP